MKAIPPSLLLLLSAAASAQTPQAFDLVCAGGSYDNDGPTGAWRRVIHVDLARRLYCEDSCVHGTPIQRVDEGALTFKDADGVFQALDRESLRYASMAAKPDPQDPGEPILLTEHGDCRVEPLSRPAPAAGG